ncbi:carboxylesterase family protein [Rhodococcus sp. T2V]|uniref:carboxylesterase/lipase family protein n=1 Tax=Rhodococcus sp. T2V TaxID=3034164 RepID=UPI0023E2986D|nr:carboxylesterase family protein [Rhodococcus sp. T2V]MDF3305757.1 carboxylesterase family protein [Rhodococcus sp. T2V]
MTVRTVHVEAGRLSGDHTDGVARFLGIPYAAAPAGERRFAPPAPAERWSGTRHATGYGATAPQPQLHPTQACLAPLVGPGWVTGDGNYLNLNVWTPDPGTNGLPVMVYLHGGGFMIGSGAAPAFDGTAFAHDGVVLVTVNYRLGAEGFLALPGETTNIGLRDQIAALHWVRDNIAGFGGDPDNVTVFGESAGGTSIAFLLHSPPAAGLFRRAIVQSGHDEMARPLALTEELTKAVAARLGTSPTADAFRACSALDLLRAQGALLRTAPRPDLRDDNGFDPGHGRALFLPTTGDDVLPDPVGVPSTHARGVELLIGTTLEEANLGFGADAFAAFDAADAVAELAATYPDAEALLERHRLHDPAVTPAQALTAAYTDLMFRSPSRRTARRHPGPAYVYEFAWRSPLHGAAHGLDVPFVFGTTQACRGLIGDDAPGALTRAMHRTWLDFAAHGDPGWPTYDIAGQAMTFDADPRLGDDTAPDDIGAGFSRWSLPVGERETRHERSVRFR